MDDIELDNKDAGWVLDIIYHAAKRSGDKEMIDYIESVIIKANKDRRESMEREFGKDAFKETQK